MLLDYLDINLTEELNLDDLPQERKQELMEQMTSTLSTRLNREVLNRMTDEQKQELDQLLENDGDVEAYVKQAVPNFEAIAAEVVASFKRDVLQLEGQIRDQVNAAS